MKSIGSARTLPIELIFQSFDEMNIRLRMYGRFLSNFLLNPTIQNYEKKTFTHILYAYNVRSAGTKHSHYGQCRRQICQGTGT